MASNRWANFFAIRYNEVWITFEIKSYLLYDGVNSENLGINKYEFVTIFITYFLLVKVTNHIITGIRGDTSDLFSRLSKWEAIGWI